MSNDTTQHTTADVRGRIIRASILPFEDEETMIAGLRAGAEAVERGELDVDDFVGVWSQYLRQLLRASSVPAPADVRELAGEIIRSLDLIARNYDSYEYGLPVMTHYDEMVDTVVALLRTPRGEGAGVVAAASAYLRALDTYRKGCRDREIPLAEYAYDEFRRLAEPLVEAEERLRAALRFEAQGDAEALAALIVHIWRRCKNEGPHYRETDEFWADFERAYQLALLRTPRGEGEEDGGEFCDLCGEEFNPSELGTVIGPLGQDDGVPRWYRCPRCARAYDAGYQQGQRDPRGYETADPTALHSDAQGEDLWEDLVFGPITQAYNEAHAARRSDAQEGEADALDLIRWAESHHAALEPVVGNLTPPGTYACYVEGVGDDPGEYEDAGEPYMGPGILGAIRAARRGEGGGV